MSLKFTKSSLLALALATSAFASADGHILARSYYSGTTVLIQLASDGSALSTKELKRIPAGGERFAVGQLPGSIPGGADVALQIGSKVKLYRYDSNGNRVAAASFNIIGNLVGMGDLDGNGQNEVIYQTDNGSLIGIAASFSKDQSNRSQVYHFGFVEAQLGGFTTVAGVFNNQVLLQKPGEEYKVRIASFDSTGMTGLTNYYDPTNDPIHYQPNVWIPVSSAWDQTYDSIGGLINTGGNGQRQVFINHRPGRVQVEWNFDTTLTSFFRTNDVHIDTPLPNRNYKVLASGN
ncbi:hypothetical protein BH11ARM1_BH11ARM1_05850 [soil metagenome]